MKSDNLISGIKQWFAAAVPSPTDKNRSVQLGCHFEEIVEMLISLGADRTDDGVAELAKLADEFKQFPNRDPEHFAAQFKALAERVDLTGLLDDLCDQIVTSVGVAHMFGMDIVGALDEVNRSNWSKFKDGKPVFDENGKIAKNKETFFRPDLSKFVGESEVSQ